MGHTFVCQGECAVEILLLHSPCCVIDLVGHSTGSNAAHLDGCGETGHTSALGESKTSGSDLPQVLSCAGAVPLENTHRVGKWSRGIRACFHSKTMFSSTPSTTEHSLLPQCCSQIITPLKSSGWFPCTVEALTSSDCSSLTAKPGSQMQQCSLPKHAAALAPWLRAGPLGVTVQTGSQGLGCLPPHKEPGIPPSVSPSLGGETALAQAH